MTAMQALIADGVKLFLYFSDADAEFIADLVKQEDAVMFSSGIMPVQANPKPHVFSIKNSPVDDHYAVAELLRSNGLRKAVLLQSVNDNDVTECSLVRAAMTDFQLDVSSTLSLSYITSDAKFDEVVQKLVTLAPDAVIGCFEKSKIGASLCVALVRAAKRSHYVPSALLLTGCVRDPSFRQELGVDARFILSTIAWKSDFQLQSSTMANWSSSRFDTELRRRMYVSATPEAAAAWAAAAVLLAGVESSNSTTPADVRSTLSLTDAQTLFGRVAFAKSFNPAVGFGRNRVYKGRVVQLQGTGERPVLISPASEALARLVMPLPPWEERKCRVDATDSVWGISYPTTFFEFETKTPIGVGTMPYVLDPGDAGAAVHFASSILGEHEHRSHDRGVGARLLALAIEKGDYSDVSLQVRNDDSPLQASYEALQAASGKASIEIVRAWLLPIVEQVFRDLGVSKLERLELARVAAVAYYVSVTKQAICAPCPIGLEAVYDQYNDLRRCTVCDKRKVNGEMFVALDIAPSKRKCLIVCEPGQEWLSTGTCVACPRGSAGPDGWRCSKCRPGRFASRTQQARCDRCPYGSISQEAAASCNMCPPGYEAGDGQVCVGCAPGSYAPTNGTHTCLRCPEGQHVADRFATACLTCPAGKHSASDAESCTACEVGRFQMEPMQRDCIHAPRGALANERGLTRFSNSLGFWIRDNSKGSDSNSQKEARECISCGDAFADCLEGERCGSGSTGVMCMSCLPGHVRSEAGLRGYTSCVRCPPFWQNVALLSIAYLALCAVCLAIVKAAGQFDTSNHDIGLVILKLMMFYVVVIKSCCSITVQLVEHRRKLLGEDLTFASRAAAKILSTISIIPLIDTEICSVTCLFQELFHNVDVSKQLADRLSLLKHSDFFSVQADNKAFESLMWNSQLGSLLFFAASPFAVLVLWWIVSFFVVNIVLLVHRRYYRDALAFYDKLTALTVSEEAANLDAVLNFETQEMHVWSVYIREYKHRLWSLWWMVSHADARRRGNMMSKRRFFRETWLLPLVFFIVFFPVLLVGVMRPLFCQQIKGESTYRMISAYELTCYEPSDAIFSLSVGSTLMWGIVSPLLLFGYVVARKKQEDASSRTSFFTLNHIERSRYAFLIHGYTEQCYYWETIFFFLKGAVLATDALFPNPSSRNVALLCLGVTYGGMAAYNKPMDKHNGNAVRKLHTQMVIAWVLHCIMMLMISFVPRHALTCDTLAKMDEHELRHFVGFYINFYDIVDMDKSKLLEVSKQNASTLAVVILMVIVVFASILLHVCVLLQAINVICSSVIERQMAHMEAEEHDDPLAYSEHSSNPLVKWITALMLRFHRAQARKSPYACMDSLLGWVTICGNRGDVVKPTAIPRGTPAQFVHGRPGLSEVPRVANDLDDAKAASKADIDWLHGSLVETMTSISERLENPTFSVSRLEFTLRASFMIAQSKVMATHDHLKSKSFWSDFDEMVDVALAETDIIDHVTAQLDAQQRVDHSTVHRKDHKRMKHAVSPKGKRHRKLHAKDVKRLSCPLIRQALTTAARSVQETELSRRSNQLVDATGAKGRLAQAKQKAQLANYIRYMFHPVVYHSGVTLDHLHIAMRELASMPRFELAKWMDKFEKTWSVHVKFRANRMSRRAGLVADKSQQTYNDNDSDAGRLSVRAGAAELLFDAAVGSGAELQTGHQNKETQAGQSFVKSQKVARSYLTKTIAPSGLAAEQSFTTMNKANATMAALNWARFMLQAGKVFKPDDSAVHLKLGDIAKILNSKRDVRIIELDEKTNAIEEQCSVIEHEIEEQKIADEEARNLEMRIAAGFSPRV
eukprot:TRINITY_DN24438_c0_g1_i2.p1 TRINITY_DN24438_c0_g1~~TRINITY_DN24438_c0_g1_i2.p1  ORF type:complete len:1951 (-),score=184.18 TRINITY_DN24438_c0_g1_i2:95-5554(-)